MRRISILIAVLDTASSQIKSTPLCEAASCVGLSGNRGKIARTVWKSLYGRFSV
jgi:hypothetical protein